ncbi:hypothetical protein T1E_2435 [Pseudomonas putida DOT-T1E]|uniref:Uncharacterized protein n=1 Tax=Pseudomonas putida (strain DOT-T1E) TaxID=1196325 RepID=I7BVR6_PSEPT|nr:hypothetical protein T1E_2435 [Pseudomonas putida DOT-T1E]
MGGSGLDRKAHARKYKPPQYLWERVYPRMRRSRQRGCLVWPLRGQTRSHRGADHREG